MRTNLSEQFLLDRSVVFLNHGSFGACPRPVFEAYQQWQLTLERQPVAFLDSRRSLAKNLLVVREAMAAEFGTSPENIAAVTNATGGLNIVAQSIPLEAGDEILTTDHEYSALEKTWTFVARRTGAVIVEVEVPLPLTSAEAFHDAIVAGMTERTKVLFLSHITSPTALVFPIESVVAEARRRGIVTVIDGAHTPGHIPLSLDALGADFYSGNCHKWMMSPKGSAFLYARPEMQAMLDPLVISHGWTADNKQPGVRGPFGNSPFVDQVEMQGTRDPAPWLAVPASIAFRREHDWWSVTAECSRLAQETAERLRALTGLPAFSTPQFCAPQMVAMPVPPCDPLALQQALNERHNIEIPVFEWKGHHVVRLSCQGYNTRDQMTLLIEALTDLLSLQAPRSRPSQLQASRHAG
ncbi:MAG TPA: aminotransferase class V-fold PLP-dependent enzyme [Arsenicitalea sp.]|nr:aminotransferase class V-fold PLP-dependent enzyme [Arsenicitalea sp.]